MGFARAQPILQTLVDELVEVGQVPAAIDFSRREQSATRELHFPPCARKALIQQGLGMTEKPQPGAPALEKGLDLLEALAGAARGMSQKQLAERVGRSVSEIFRMLVALERRGYVARDPATGEYTLTLKLFRIASQFPPTERLLKAALPVMEQLASRVQLSCHLTVLHREQFMVIARIEPEWLMGWSVKVGAVFPLTQQYASAKVLAAFQLEGRRQELAQVIATNDRISIKKALAALDRISAEGGNFSNDDGYTRILAYSCPIIEVSGRAVAAMTVPLVRQDQIPATEASTIAAELRSAARIVSEKIGGVS